MTPIDRLDESALHGIAALCERAVTDPPSRDELRDSLFGPHQPAVVRGDPAIGVVASVRAVAGVGDPKQGFIRLLAVDPDHRGKGHGRALLGTAENDLLGRGCTSVTAGADAPYYLWPGVDVRETALLCLLERAHYQRREANFHMAVDLAHIPPDPGGTSLATPADRDNVREWTDGQYPNWTPEVLRALDRGTLVISRDDDGIAGFCAYDVTRRGLLGPVAVRLDLIGKGAGVALLLSALHRMRADGRQRIEVSWVGPIVPYARAGGRVSRVFFVYRKERA